MLAQPDVTHAYLLERCLRLEVENDLLRQQMDVRAASLLITRAVVRLHDERHMAFSAIRLRLGLTADAAYKRYVAAQRGGKVA